MDEGIKILCVDDERNVLKALERLFLDEDYEIITALSGEEGLACMEAQDKVQVIISDYRMPGMNGVEFLQEVCRHWPATVRIVLSGYADTAAVVSAINEGQIYKFIPKPWNDDELKVTIQNALEKYSLERKNEELLAELRIANANLNRAVDHLEATVAERTAKLVYQNQALTGAQNILHALPFAVFGIDLQGTLVQCNGQGLELLGKRVAFPLGHKRQDLFPDAVNALVDEISRSSCATEVVQMNGRPFLARLTYLKESDQEGFILVLQEKVG